MSEISFYIVLFGLIIITLYSMFKSEIIGYYIKDNNGNLIFEIIIGKFYDDEDDECVSTIGFDLDLTKDKNTDYEPNKIHITARFGLMYHHIVNFETNQVSRMFIVGPFIYFREPINE